MQNKVLKSLCIGCGLCPEIAPDLYRMDDDDGKAAAVKSEISEKEAASANEAAVSCPVNAIEIE